MNEMGAMAVLKQIGEEDAPSPSEATYQNQLLCGWQPTARYLHLGTFKYICQKIKTAIYR